MSAQRLSPRSVRRIERSTGLHILRAWSHGGYVMAFVTAAHVHGEWDKKTGEYRYIPNSQVVHYTSCAELFGAEKSTDDRP